MLAARNAIAGTCPDTRKTVVEKKAVIQYNKEKNLNMYCNEVVRGVWKDILSKRCVWTSRFSNVEPLHSQSFPKLIARRGYSALRTVVGACHVLHSLLDVRLRLFEATG